MERPEEDLTSSYNYGDDANNKMIQLQDKENVLLGIVGAFAGCLIGAILIIVLSYFGYIASISGVVMGACALRGYILLGKRLSKKGIVLTILIMIIMVFISYGISFGIAVAQAFDVDILTGIVATPLLLSEEGVDLSVFYKDLVILYLFTALGAFPTIKDYLRKS